MRQLALIKDLLWTGQMIQDFTNTLEVSTSHWNYINEMYSDIRQGEQETTDQLNQCIKMLVKRCGYTSAEEKTRC